MFAVLYVDDEPALLDLAKTFLELSGRMRIDTVNCVSEAIEQVQRKKYDGIITDYEMPAINGIAFLRYIRQNYRDLPVILFTGRGREEIAIEALNSGADFYLQKGGEPKTQFAELEYNLLHAIERRKAQEELKESRQLMANIIDFLPDATFAINRENVVISWNRRMEKITGVPAADIIGRTGYREALARFNENRIPLIDVVLNPGHETSGVSPIRDGNAIISEFYSQTAYGGKGAHLWLIASPLYDAGGNAIGAIESVRDVSQRRETEESLKKTHDELSAAYEQLAATEEELRANYEELTRGQRDLLESEERYRNIVEDQTEFICRFFPDGRLSFVNGAYCRYFGLDPAACIGKPHTVRIPPGDRESVNRHLAAFSPDHPVATIEHRILMPNGEVRWQRWSDRAVFNKNGKVTEYQSVGRDTTGQHGVIEQLKRTNTELSAAYEQLAATEEELRANYEELTRGQRDLLESEERYRNIVEDQTEFICRFRPDGTHIFVNDAYCRYFGKTRDEIAGHRFVPEIPKDDHVLLSAHFAAITPDHPVATVEHRILMPNGEIRWQQWSDRGVFDKDGRVAEYQSVGRDITDRKHMEQALGEANRKLTLLSGITRHDILNQLTALQGYLGLIQTRAADPFVKNLAEQALRTGEVIHDQISFTRQYESVGTQTPLWQNVYATATSVSMDGGFRMVTVDPALKEIEIYADPLLKLIFYNLFENAWMHVGRHVKVRVSGAMTENGAEIIVSDDGKGIAAKEKEKIFQKGYGTHTGLGLYLVREILAITSLAIGEDGVPGTGARFVIHVPVGMVRKVSA